jgi:hypothetical protein
MTRERTADASLACLMDQRAACVREVVAVSRVLAEVQGELRDWRDERSARGAAAPESLKALWTDLEEHERSLVLRLLGLQTTRRAISAAIQERLRQRPMAC